MSDETPGTNTFSVRRALDDLGIAYQAGPNLPNGEGVTSLAFDADGLQQGWLTTLFSSEQEPVVRMYSLLELDVSKIDRLRLLEAINLANYEIVLDGLLDFNADSNRIRVRDVYRGDGKSVNSTEFPEPLGAHLSKTSLWNITLAKVLVASEPIADILRTRLTEAHALLIAARDEELRGEREQAAAP